MLLYISHSREVGGAESYLRSLMLHGLTSPLSASGGVALVCRTDAALNDWAAELERAGVSVHRIDLKRPSDYRRLLRLARRALLVHLNLAYPVGKYQLVAAGLVRLAGRPLVITHHLTFDLTQIRMPSPRRIAWATAFRSYGWIARRHIALSKPGRELLVEKYGFPLRATVVIHNGIDPRPYKPLDPATRNSARDALASLFPPGPEDELLLAITVARLNEQKGLFDLLEAATRVGRRLPQARFVIVGSGELESDLQRRIVELGPAGRVVLAGQQSPGVVANWLQASDLFVLPSHREGLPLALIEAMASGCAAVATSVGGVPEVITDESMGLLVPARAPDRLAEAIIALLEDRRRRVAMGSRAQRQARECFSLDRCLKETFASYAGIGVAGRAS